MNSAVFDVLRKVTTATISTMLLKKGIRRCWMNGPKPLVPGGERLIGPAFTLRFVPAREDLATPESWSKPISTRSAIEAMPEGVIVVADAMGVSGAGIFGDILCARMKKRNVTALVTDGVLRDRAGVLASGLPVWCAGMAAPASVNGLTFVGWNEPIGCGGVAVFPDDFIVVDDDGAVVIPKDLIEFVAHEGAEHELYESWVFTEVEKGVQLPGLYPPNEEVQGALSGVAAQPRLTDRRVFFVLSKLLAFFTQPSNLIVLLGLLGLVADAHAVRPRGVAARGGLARPDRIDRLPAARQGAVDTARKSVSALGRRRRAAGRDHRARRRRQCQQAGDPGRGRHQRGRRTGHRGPGAGEAISGGADHLQRRRCRPVRPSRQRSRRRHRPVRKPRRAREPAHPRRPVAQHHRERRLFEGARPA